MIAILLRIVVFVIAYKLVVAAIRFVSQTLLGGSQQSKNAASYYQSAPTNDVIDICPECGHEMGRRHRCKK